MATILASSFTFPSRPKSITNESFGIGEMLFYRMNYSIFTLGRCTAIVQPNLQTYNQRQCYKIDFQARSVGLVNLVSDVENDYFSIVDTASMLPYTFYRKQREGRFEVEEQTLFDQMTGKVTVRKKDRHNGGWKDPVTYSSPNQVRDLISGLFYIRTIDLSKLKPNDTITVDGFFEDEFYAMRIVYKGRKIIKTTTGRINTIVFKPSMPASSVFERGESVTVYLSDDKNRIPVKIEARLLIGSAGIELTGYEGLRNPMAFASK